MGSPIPTEALNAMKGEWEGSMEGVGGASDEGYVDLWVGKSGDGLVGALAYCRAENEG